MIKRLKFLYARETLWMNARLNKPTQAIIGLVVGGSIAFLIWRTCM